MKKIYKALRYIFPVLITVLALVSCDKDFSTIQSDVLGEGNFNFNAADTSFTITSYNKKIDTVQVNGLSSNMLGVYNDPVFGRTTASIVTQVTPTLNDPDFGFEREIDSVVLTIPYFSTQVDVEDDGKPVYRLDSLFVKDNNTAEPGSFQLSIYQNDYPLRDFAFSSEDVPQYYYSLAENNPSPNDNFIFTGTSAVNFDENIGAMLYQNNAFTPSPDPIETNVVTGTETVTVFSEPAIRLNLASSESQKTYWKNLILDMGGTPELSNANQFRNYFKGLYIKAETSGDDGSLVMLNLLSSNANLVVYYKRKINASDEEATATSYTLNFSGNRVNTLINNYVGLSHGDKDNGDAELFLKGPAGSMAIIELFDDDELDGFKDLFIQRDDQNEFLEQNGNKVLKRLINEAQIVIHEDEVMRLSPEISKYPNGDDHSGYLRLYLYDLKNNIPIIDYFSDPTDNLSNPINSKVFSLGQRLVDEDTGEVTYKLRITDHLNNILVRDSTNVKLGLVVSTNVNATQNAQVLNSGSTLTGVPSASIISPKGTVLNGSNRTDGKEMKFEIFFTEAKR
ncbi:DUF4270 domain-containing protein [Hyunsoonleella sp. SJ7]|uniref:DUF4270 domain-containing protein n=1 Tax=Hyunsoonleella aquatilis TaxID=2762758 RepID=A0A923H7R9_9FLAO|nr:DUF4270 domain-containing protein [Hyunsoonleella aquatilis]MBC3758311.1 DUF4270 domain-containing protein [Hyunsoonleella aquatilis]